MHRYAINGCLIFVGYQFYAFLRDYNDFFLHARQVNELNQADVSEDGPINGKTLE
jgi:hypothetical protein